MKELLDKFLEFGNDHFNTILVTLVLVITLMLTMHVIHHGGDSSAVQWFENLTGQFASALLTLLVANKVIGPKGPTNPTGGDKQP